MKTFFNLEGLSPDQFHTPALTVGMFDGVHRGHKAVLSLLRRTADGLSGDAVVVTFERHPKEVLCGTRPNPIISFHHRLRLIEAEGVDACIVLRFNRTLSQTSAASFLGEMHTATGLKTFVAGPDTTVGRDCEGTAPALAKLGEDLGFTVAEAPTVTLGGEPVSSSRIRALILAGEVDEVSAMLGRSFSLFGTVVRGDSRGRRLGFPTANLDLRGVMPPPGVYATLLTWQGRPLPSVTSIGTRPTFGPNLPPTVETHVFDFDGDLYGADVELVLVERLRAENVFPSEAALVQAIEGDCRAARDILATALPRSG